MSGFRFAAVFLLCAAVSVAGAARAGEHRDPQGVFSVTYDETFWQRDDTEELSLECREEACKDATVGCFFTKEPARGASAAAIMRAFDAERIARAQIEAFAEQKASLEKEFEGVIAWNRDVDIAPVLVRPYAVRDLAGLPVHVAEFRLSMLGRAARYASYMTAAPGYSIAVVCHASEAVYDTWLPRFEALIEAMRTPETRGRRR